VIKICASLEARSEYRPKGAKMPLVKPTARDAYFACVLSAC